jgi:hypothetical protein
MNSRWVVVASLALSGCLETTGAMNGVTTGAAAPAYRPKVDLAAAPNGGADYEKHVAQCNSYVAHDTEQKSNGAMMSGALQGLATGVTSMWSGGFSGSSVASVMGSAAATGGTTMLQEQAKQKAQAQMPATPAAAAGPGAEFVRTCMKSYGYKIAE